MLAAMPTVTVQCQTQTRCTILCGSILCHRHEIAPIARHPNTDDPRPGAVTFRGGRILVDGNCDDLLLIGYFAMCAELGLMTRPIRR